MILFVRTSIMIKLLSFFLFLYVIFFFLINSTLGQYGLLGEVIINHPILFFSIYSVLMSHFTITAMSLSFHRYHTHKGVILNKWIDIPMQVWLWMVTSLSKVDWVSDTSGIMPILTRKRILTVPSIKVSGTLFSWECLITQKQNLALKLLR